MATTEHKQSVRNAWINRLRDEALRMRRQEVSKCVHIGILIATYADADGTNAFPSYQTLGAIAGCTEETVTRCVKVLMAVGLLRRKRRPNLPSVYLLVPPVGKEVPWLEHLHLYTDTRQAKRRKEQKAKEIACALAKKAEEEADEGSRTPFQNGVREPFPDRVPDTVPAGGSEIPGPRSGTGSDPVRERVPDTVPAGGDQYRPTFGRDPGTDQTMADDSPQPPTRGRARPGESDQSSAEPDDVPYGRCEECGRALTKPGRTRCSRHQELPAHPKTRRGRAIQPPIIAVVPDVPPAPAEPARPPFQWKREDPLAPARICGCGREFRSRTDQTCQDCQFATYQEAETA
ncbi:hypothetical protein [Streptomyces carpinensis]|uniref:Helix-turn-helix domain-containing protein n=1 Tax=Streptomyces carpinensis TaxID=66369 RepID=A0ABV1VVS8_9ACTN|nr:hypothetical protein [Streptomyces carpinensis]